MENGNIDPTMEKEIMEEMKELEEEEAEENQENQFQTNQELQEAYGYPEPNESMNQHSFLHKAAFSSPDTVRTTFLYEGELGKGLFTVRFLMDMKDVAKHHLDKILHEVGLNPNMDNKIAHYFEEKIQNVTASGMSNKGFAMNLNVTKKMDALRRRMREMPENLKGGKKI